MNMGKRTNEEKLKEMEQNADREAEQARKESEKPQTDTIGAN